MIAVVSLMRSFWLFGLFHGSMWSICWNVGHSYVFVTSQPDVTLGRLSVWWMIWESSEAEEHAVFGAILVRPFESFESLWPVLGCLSRTSRQLMFCPGLTVHSPNRPLSFVGKGPAILQYLLPSSSEAVPQWQQGWVFYIFLFVNLEVDEL